MGRRIEASDRTVVVRVRDGMPFDYRALRERGETTVNHYGEKAAATCSFAGAAAVYFAALLFLFGQAQTNKKTR